MTNVALRALGGGIRDECCALPRHPGPLHGALAWPLWLSTPGHDEYPVRGIPYAASKAAVIALTVQYAKSLPEVRVNASDPGYTATEFNGYSGHQTMEEGTDATVRLATIGPGGPTGEFHDRTGRIEY